MGALVSPSLGQPVYLEVGPNPVLAFLHRAVRSQQGIAVLLCGPFGWDDVCSYRARRAWADALARAGHPTARIDFPGAGDSGGSPRDPERLEAWTVAATGAARWLRDATGCSRIAAIGIGLGGMVACRAVATGAPIDDLVLWAVPSRGRTLLRELTAFARLAASQFPDPRAAEPPRPPEGLLEVSGFLLSRETANALAGLDLTELPVPGAAERRILLLGRDELPVDGRLQEHFERAEAQVTAEPGRGYSALMTNPQDATTPHELFARTISWLGEAPSPQDQLRASAFGATGSCAPSDAAATERGSLETCSYGEPIRETVLALDLGPGKLLGVLAEPVRTRAAPVCVVFLNAGAVRRIGPNRAWVEMSRRWAARGVPAVRIDLEGLGDSDGDEGAYVNVARFYSEELVAQTLAVLDELQGRGLPGRFVLAGLCSGAYWAFHAAIRDERVAAVFMVDLYGFHWSETLVAKREARRTLALARAGGMGWLRRDVLTPARLRQLARSAASLPGQMGVLRRGQDDAENDPAFDLDRLRDAGAQALLLLARGAPLYDDFVRNGRIDQLQRWPNLRLETIPSRDHTFRAIWLQEYVCSSLDRALDRVLEAADAPARW